MLWAIYLRCKQNVPTFLSSIPDGAWETLFKSQSEFITHLTIIAEDKESANKALSSAQWLAYMEGLHVAGRTEEALKRWQSQQEAFASRIEVADQYWELGVRFFAALGRPQDAQLAAQTYLREQRTADPRILFPVISAWSRALDKESAEKAWALYLQLKTYLREAMDEADYDVVSTAFLNNARIDLALAVFKDMILSQRKSAHESVSLYQKAVGFVGDLQASSINEQEVNRISIAALTSLPRSMQNKFFYGSWIKKLIGLGEIDAAAAVVELMYERGVKPDAKFLNGIIGAWLRQSDTKSREKAERMGWAMVQQRFNFVTQRNTRDLDLSKPGEAQRLTPERFGKEIQIPRFLQRNVPAATIETFSILLLHYTRRSKEPLVTYLLDSMNASQMPPNSFIMNHILYSDLRKHDLSAAWNRYVNMSKTVSPDLETYTCLWDCGKVQYSPSNARISPTFPPATTLYHEMNDWFQSLSDHEKSRASSEMSPDLYDQIIRCFTLSKDMKGTFLALQGLAQLFQCYPTARTSQLIVLQLSRVLPREPGMHLTPSMRRRNMRGNPNSKAQIARVTALLETVIERRAASLIEEGKDLESLSETEQGIFQLGCLGELLVTVMKRLGTPDGNLANEISMVAKRMGVESVELKDYGVIDTSVHV